MGNHTDCICAQPLSPAQRKLAQVRYGLVDGEPFQCLSSTEDEEDRDADLAIGASRSVLYSCATCKFSLCTPCCMRAVHVMQRLAALDAALHGSHEAQVEWMQGKLMVVGGPRAGKTSFVRNLLGFAFDSSLASTVGVALTYAHARREKQSWREMGDGERAVHAVRAAVEALEKEQHERELAGGGRRGAMVWDGEAQELHRPGLQGRPAGRYREWVRAGEESDVQRETRLRLLFDPSTKANRLKMVIWDVAGQRVFNSLHHLYLTRYGVYLVVFNVAELAVDDKSETLGFLEFWMNTVNLHAKGAPVMLIGTHWDQLAQTVAKPRNSFTPRLGFAGRSVPALARKVDGVLQETLLKKFPQVRRNIAAKLSFFPVSNLTKYGVENLRKQIEATTKSEEAFNMKLPMKWLKLLDHLTSSEAPPWLTLTEINERAKDFGIASGTEIEALLRMCHEAGLLLHFTSTDVLAKTVILRPQWLLDEVSKVVRDSSIHKYDMERIERAGLLQDVESLQKHGIATVDLLQYFWGKEHYHFFVDLLTRTLLLSTWRRYLETGLESYYLIPSLLKRQRIAAENWPTRFKIDFSESFLPDGCFERLTCLCLDLMEKRGHTFSKPPEVSTRYARLCLTGDDEEVLLVVQGNEILVEIAKEEAALVARSTILCMLDKVNRDVLKSGLKWTVSYYDSVSESYISAAEAETSKLRPWFPLGVEQMSLAPPAASLELSAFIETLFS